MEDSARLLEKFISTGFYKNYTDEDINMFIRRTHRQPKISRRPSERTKTIAWSVYELAIAQEVWIISLTLRRVLNVCVNQMHSKALTERYNKALKYRKELLETEPYLTIKFDHPTVLRSRPKGSRSKWKVVIGLLLFYYFEVILL